ncbi:MAG: glycoside hydrolase family 78 protein [Limisphaerales bacterium]
MTQICLTLQRRQGAWLACMLNARFLLVLTAFALLPVVAAASNPPQPADLRCEYLKDPLGIDAAQPRLSWILEPASRAARSQSQTAFQILVAASRKNLGLGQGDLWDSGKVLSDSSIQIPYAGQRLMSGQECFWKLRIWDQEGRVSGWSEPARWSMGLLDQSDWHAKWIGAEDPTAPSGAIAGPEDRRLPARLMRREFALHQKVRRATAYVSGLGLFEFSLNGRKIGDHVLEPGLTDYSKRLFYVTFDVTKDLKKGANAAGIMLGNGRFYAPRLQVPTATVSYGFPKLLFELKVEYMDGATEEIVSDNTWNVTTNGPIRANNEYDGEAYDARMELEGWNGPGFDDSQWSRARIVAPPGGVLAAQMIEPIRVTQTLRPVSMTAVSAGVYIFDFGQNMAGWCRLRVRGPAGSEVSLRHAETLKADGTLYLDNIRSAKVTDAYVLKGKGMEVHEPRFTYHGFRYVEMTGFPGKPSLSCLEARVVHDDLESAGDFACSNPLLNRIYRNVLWGVRGNYRSIPTDCCQRDERQGWLGDRSAESKGETYMFNTAPLYGKWLRDMADAQKENGSVPDVCPAYWPIYSDNVTWPSSTVIIPGTLRDQFADQTVMATHYASAKRWIDFMSGFLQDGIIARDSYGDWCVPPEEQKLIHSNDPKRKTDKALLATAYFYYDLCLMRQCADLLGKPADAQPFASQAARIKTAFNARFLKPEAGQYDNGTQTSCVLPLAFGLVPPEYQQRVFDHLVNKIAQESQGHIGTGLIGGQWLMRVLSDNGRSDLAYTIATQETYPSWGYMISKGATTIWELWNGNTADPAMNSGNHVMLVGDLGIWLYEDLAGIKPDPERPGFKHIVMRPEPVGDLRFVKASHRSSYGLIASSWQREGDHFGWQIAVPVNTTATIYLPAREADSVTENGMPAGQSKGVKFLKMEQDRAVFSVGSGNYRFESR